MYTPDYWIILRITGSDPHYKLFATWASSYLQGAHWRQNSGITKVIETDTHYLVHGYSGSVYRCRKDSYGIIDTIGQRLAENINNTPHVELLKKMPDMLNIDWILEEPAIQ